MGRINVYDYDEYDGKSLAGWFDLDAAECIEEDREWDGQNMVSVNCSDEFDHQRLYRTKGGRWVLENWSQWHDRGTTYEFIGDAQAREWLLRNDHDAVVERFFGEIEDERGPGRPEIGPAVNLRFPVELLSKTDAEAKERGISRAELIRSLVAAGLE